MAETARQARGARSRRALIDATLQLMAQGADLSTVAIARRAGLAQPTFYAHFRNVEACRLAAMEAATRRIEENTRNRRALFRQGRPYLETMEQYLASWLAQVRVTGPLWDALGRYRNEESSFGHMVRALGRQSRREIAEELWEHLRVAGMRPEHYPQVAHLAEMLIASTAATARMLHEGELEDEQAAARTLARSFVASLEATVRQPDC